MPLCCICTIDKYSIATVMEPETKKHISLILQGLFQHFLPTTIKSVFARKTIEEAVTVSNEHFALMVIDYRWELWEAIVVKRK